MVYYPTREIYWYTYATIEWKPSSVDGITLIAAAGKYGRAKICN